MSATSYGGNSLACRAAIESINFIRSNNLLSSVKEKSKLLSSGLNKIADDYPEIIRSINGLGMLFGMEISDKKIAETVVRQMAENRILVYQSFGNPFVIMIEPPLIISVQQIEKVVEAFNLVLNEISI